MSKGNEVASNVWYVGLFASIIVQELSYLYFLVKLVWLAGWSVVSVKGGGILLYLVLRMTIEVVFRAILWPLSTVVAALDPGEALDAFLPGVGFVDWALEVLGLLQ